MATRAGGDRLTEFTVVPREAPPSPAPAAPPVPTPVPEDPPAPAPAGPPGRPRSPGGVILLSIVTFGIYYHVWLWLTSRELDAYTEGAARSHGVAKAGITLGLLCLGSWLMLNVAAAFAAFGSGGAVLVGALALVILPLALVALVLLFLTLWRIWNTVGDEERRRGVQTPLSAAFLLVLLFIPYVNIFGYFYALWRTQSGLNGLWKNAAAAHRTAA